MSPRTSPQDVKAVRSDRVYRPAFDLVERDDHYELRADMPGARPEDVEVRFERGLLTVHARVSPRKEAAFTDEYGVGDWQLAFRFGETVDPEGIEAVYRQGVLALTLPKSESARRRRIDVRSN